jgi:class 3 adenylate cyclase/tetratricopeptide (TPR) repeat protein
MRVCPSCAEENPDNARFCLNCATPFGTIGARYERKFATALFADIVGSTGLAEREDPEVVQALIGRAFDRVSTEIERYGGLIEKFVGDAVLAVFGVPVAHEDDPERAVRAALEMQAVLSELNRTLASEDRPTLEMRMGLEAGEVLVDLERAGASRDRMLTGDAVNTAARLQSAAESGHVVVGPAVFGATKDVIEYREMPPLELKGKSGRVPAWDALRVKARRRGERPPLGLEARLVGRDEELSVLKQTLHLVESEGRPALVTVLGNAGVGKSRLAWEFAKHVEGLPQILYWRRGRSLAYGNVSYSALAEAVKAQCEILEDDPADVVADKVDRSVEELTGDRELAAPILALVGARTEHRFERDELFDAWRRYLERLAARYPLVLALEDLHWADAGLLDFLDHLSDWAAGPIMIVTLARPELLEIRPGWGGGKRNYSAIYLDPLTSNECEAMVEDLLGHELPDEVKRLVSEHSEGNPLHAEEIVRMLIDRGVLRATEASRWELAQPLADIEVPRSIHALIAARLDSLPADEKLVLQDAAVVGRIFWLGAVARLGGDADAVRAALGRLRVKDVVTPRDPPTFSGDLELAFHHVLIRDVAYESLPKLLRAAKHVEVARWAEERAGERSEDLAEVVAAHYLQAVEYRDELGERPDPDIDRAASRWLTEAGQRASSLLQQEEALRWLSAARRIAERTSTDEASLAWIAEAVAEAADGLRPYEEVARAYRDALDRYLALGADADAGRMEVALGGVAFQSNDHEHVRSWLESGIARLEPLGESSSLASGLDVLGNYLRRRGEIEESEALLRRAVAIAARLEDPVVEGHAAVSLGVVLLHLHRIGAGMEMIERGFEIARDARNLGLLLRAGNSLASCLMDYAPDYERGRRILMEGIELSRRSGRWDHQAWMWGNLGNYAEDQGRLDELELAARSSIEIGERLSYPYALSSGEMLLGHLAYLRGELDATDVHLDVSQRTMSHREEVQAVPYRMLPRGLAAAARGDVEQAIRIYLEAVEMTGLSSMLGMVDELYSELARTLVGAGRRADADPYLDALRTVAPGRPNAEAFLWWAEGVAGADAAKIRDAADRFGSLTRPIDEGRCFLDLADLGEDPEVNVERARALFGELGAAVYLREADRRFPQHAERSSP